MGLKVIPINVEVFVTSGKPGITIVGLGDKAISESRERIYSSLNYIGFSVPAKKITINLSPADLQKEGAHYDLPMALGILSAMGVFEKDHLNESIFMGELSLDARIYSVQGVLPAALYASEKGKKIYCPDANAHEASWLDTVEIYAAQTLSDIVQSFHNKKNLRARSISPKTHEKIFVNMRDIKGQELGKRAIEIAAAGGHNVLFWGPPGSGKTLLSRALFGILPPLSSQSALEISVIHSLSGNQSSEKQVCFVRPFRCPHHTSSAAALVGGGHRARPGEISMAHKGVLFLDELPEFSPKALDALREPLESRKIQISRANYSVEYPADFQLVAAMNPCKCGNLGQPNQCAQAPRCATHYQNRISGPLWDRFDLCVSIQPVDVEKMSTSTSCETSEIVRERVKMAHRHQYTRMKVWGGSSEHYTNAHLEGEIMDSVCKIDDQSQKILINSVKKFHISARGYNRILRVARTIADLDQKESIEAKHLLESLQYRFMKIF